MPFTTHTGVVIYQLYMNHLPFFGGCNLFEDLCWFLYQSVHEGRIYQLKLFCAKDYPEKPPTVCFHTRVNMTCVNPESGMVDPKKFGMLVNWQREYTMEDILTQLRKWLHPTTRNLFNLHKGPISS